MTRLPEIWVCLKKSIRKGHWTNIETIYEIVQNSLSLDKEDFQPQSPSSDIPKWKKMFEMFYNTEKRQVKLNGTGMLIIGFSRSA